jgi:hypothetical protein
MHTIQNPNVLCTQEYETQVTINVSPLKSMSNYKCNLQGV